MQCSATILFVMVFWRREKQKFLLVKFEVYGLQSSSISYSMYQILFKICFVSLTNTRFFLIKNQFKQNYNMLSQMVNLGLYFNALFSKWNWVICCQVTLFFVCLSEYSGPQHSRQLSALPVNQKKLYFFIPFLWSSFGSTSNHLFASQHIFQLEEVFIVHHPRLHPHN